MSARSLAAACLAAGLLAAGAHAGAEAPPAAAQGEVTLSVGQLQINQRISQAALHRADAVEAHLDGREPAAPAARPGGARFTLSAAQLRINQRIAQAAVRRVNALAARAEGRSAPAARSSSGSGRITLSVTQLRINQRITQAAVRRVNALVEELGVVVPPRPRPPRARPSTPTVVVPARVTIGERVRVRLEAFPVPPGTTVQVSAVIVDAGSGGPGVRLGEVTFDATGSAALTVTWPRRYMFCAGVSSCSSVPAQPGPTTVSATSASPHVMVTTRTTVVAASD